MGCRVAKLLRKERSIWLPHTPKDLGSNIHTVFAASEDKDGSGKSVSTARVKPTP